MIAASTAVFLWQTGSLLCMEFFVSHFKSANCCNNVCVYVAAFWLELSQTVLTVLMAAMCSFSQWLFVFLAQINSKVDLGQKFEIPFMPKSWCYSVPFVLHLEWCGNKWESHGGFWATSWKRPVDSRGNTRDRILPQARDWQTRNGLCYLTHAWAGLNVNYCKHWQANPTRSIHETQYMITFGKTPLFRDTKSWMETDVSSVRWTCQQLACIRPQGNVTA